MSISKKVVRKTGKIRKRRDIMCQQSLIHPVSDIVSIQRTFLNSKALEERRSLGQFFTGLIVSDYMASLITLPDKKTARILDAGAGTGILTASAALHCLDMGCTSVHAVLYELDAEALSGLEQTLHIISRIYQSRKASFTCEILCEDFVLTRPDKNADLQHFDVAVINPPYFKYSVQSSPYAKATADLYHGSNYKFDNPLFYFTNICYQKGMINNIWSPCLCLQIPTN